MMMMTKTIIIIKTNARISARQLVYNYRVAQKVSHYH